MLLPHNKVSGGVQGSQIMIPSFFDRFYVMPLLTNGVHYMSLPCLPPLFLREDNIAPEAIKIKLLVDKLLINCCDQKKFLMRKLCCTSARIL